MVARSSSVKLGNLRGAVGQPGREFVASAVELTLPVDSCRESVPPGFRPVFSCPSPADNSFAPVLSWFAPDDSSPSPVFSSPAPAAADIRPPR